MSYVTHSFLFFLNDTATTEIYTLSLHDALPIFLVEARDATECGHVEIELLGQTVNAYRCPVTGRDFGALLGSIAKIEDRKSTRLNSSHSQISYAVLCLINNNKPFTYRPTVCAYR